MASVTAQEYAARLGWAVRIIPPPEMLDNPKYGQLQKEGYDFCPVCQGRAKLPKAVQILLSRFVKHAALDKERKRGAQLI